MLAVGLAVGDIVFIDRRLTWGKRVARGTAGIFGVGLAAALGFILPVPELPVPSGPESIGTVSFELVDREREEIYGSNPGDPRRFMAQVWYPGGDTTGLDPVPWSEDWDVVAPAMARSLLVPSWFLDHTEYVESHTYSSLAVAAGTYPVVIYSHGWTGFRTIAINQIETLVSNGYIVIAPDHTYGSMATRFPNGEVVGYDLTALPDEESVSADEYAVASGDLVFAYAADLVTILDTLDQGIEGPFGNLVSSMDLTRIGIYGHSTGGGAAVKVCLEEERCDAVLGLDAWIEPLPDEVIRQTLTRPALFMRSDGWRGTPKRCPIERFGRAKRERDLLAWNRRGQPQ